MCGLLESCHRLGSVNAFCGDLYYYELLDIPFNVVHLAPIPLSYPQDLLTSTRGHPGQDDFMVHCQDFL
jgi:hypothetical protein